MKVFPSLLAACATACAIASPPVSGAEVTRQYTLGASGACQPFAPTTQVRYSSTGLRNSGTSQFYAVCSMEGDFRGYNGIGAYNTDIVVANRGATAQTVACTLRAGYIQGTANDQGAFPRSVNVAPGAQAWISWYANALSGDVDYRIANPNFTCTVKPGIEITHINLRFAEDVGD